MAQIVYCDYHLTIRGWIKGTQRWDDGTLTNVNPPGDSALTVRYTAPINRPPYVTTQWKTDKTDKLNELLKLYGDLPDELKALAL